MPNNCENRLLSLLNAQEWHLDRLYAEYSRQFGSIFRDFGGKIYKYHQKELDKVLNRFHDDLEKTFAEQISNSFSISNLCNDDRTKDYLKDLEVSSEQKAAFLRSNPKAVASFLSRKQAGLNLSDRVWKLTNQTEEALLSGLESGIFDGRPAADMARDLKRYLKEPDQRFRRVRNADGKLVLSNPAKNYNPGQGVYRSSYKNALRLTRNEINIAYRTNDFERRKNMPWVMGQRIRLSSAHPKFDICDELVGTYPKEFKFVGWHPNCLCISDSLLLPREKFKEYLAGGSIDQRHLVKSVPKNALDYLNANADKINNWKSKPYFLKDNYKYSNGLFVPKKYVTPNLKDKLPEPSKPELQTAKLIKNTEVFTDNAIKNTIVSYAKDRPELFNGELKKVSISKSIKGMMHNSRMYINHKYAKEKGNSIAIKKASYRMMDGTIFSPNESLRDALTAIKNNEKLTFNQEYSLESLWHEIRHAGANGWGDIRKITSYKTNSMEIVNQFCARYSYDEFIQDLGGKAVHKTKVITDGYGYGTMLKNFRATLKKYNITELDAHNYLKDKIQTQYYENIHNTLTKFLTEKGVKDANDIIVRMGLLKEETFKNYIER